MTVSCIPYEKTVNVSTFRLAPGFEASTTHVPDEHAAVLLSGWHSARCTSRHQTRSIDKSPLQTQAEHARLPSLLHVGIFVPRASYKHLKSLQYEIYGFDRCVSSDCGFLTLEVEAEIC